MFGFDMVRVERHGSENWRHGEIQVEARRMRGGSEDSRGGKAPIEESVAVDGFGRGGKEVQQNVVDSSAPSRGGSVLWWPALAHHMDII